MRAYQHMLDVGSRVMHVYAAVMTEAGNHAPDQTMFVLLIRQALGCLRRMLKSEGLTLSDIRVTTDEVREGCKSMRWNFDKRMADPEFDACFNPERY